MTARLLTLLALAAPAAGLAAQANGSPPPEDDSPPRARAVRTAQPPVIDGRLDDAAWAAAVPLAGFLQHEPQDGAPGSERTEVRVLFDGDALYIGAWMFDRAPRAIVRGEARRDVSLNDMDAVLLVLDTYRDGQNAYVFGTTPAGIQYDGQVTREGEGGGGGGRQQQGSGGGVNVNWDGAWEVAATTDSTGWFAEFRIPFATLRYGGSGVQTWGLNVARHLRRRNEQQFWAPVPRQHSVYRVSLAGSLEGLDPPQRLAATVTPYVLGTAHRDFTVAGSTDLDAEVGGDAKVTLGSSLALDVTVNTDFAQVEVDEEQINLTRFGLFFPEKRPFFLENAGIFAVGASQAVEMFFSRRIGIGPAGEAVPLRGGGRITGRVGGLTVGLLDLQTAGVAGVVAPTNYGAARMLREFGSRSRLGALATTRLNTDSTGDWGTTLALDGRLGIGEALTFDGYTAETRTAAGVGGRVGSVGAALSTRDWNVSLTARAVGDGFAPEVGYLQRGAHRFVSASVLRRIRTPGISWFRELRPHVTYLEYWGLDGFSETRMLHVDSHFAFENGAFFQLPAINFTREGLRDTFAIASGVAIPPGTYDNVDWGFAYNTNRSAPVSLSGRIDIGGFYSGHRYGGSVTLAARSGSTLHASLRVNASDVVLPEGRFQTALAGLRVSYAFSPSVYVQSLVQYSNRSDQVTGNVRFGWLSTAGTGLFLVLNTVERVDQWPDLATNDRALIVKFTRQFRLAG